MRAAVMSWVEPGSTSLTHTGYPVGSVSTWMLPLPCCLCLPEYQISWPLGDGAADLEVAIRVPSRHTNAYPSRRAGARMSRKSGACAAMTSMASCRYR